MTKDTTGSVFVVGYMGAYNIAVIWRLKITVLTQCYGSTFGFDMNVLHEAYRKTEKQITNTEHTQHKNQCCFWAYLSAPEFQVFIISFW